MDSERVGILLVGEEQDFRNRHWPVWEVFHRFANHKSLLVAHPQTAAYPLFPVRRHGKIIDPTIAFYRRLQTPSGPRSADDLMAKPVLRGL
jgi:hypothetical protein